MFSSTASLTYWHACALAPAACPDPLSTSRCSPVPVVLLWGRKGNRLRIYREKKNPNHIFNCDNCWTNWFTNPVHRAATKADVPKEGIACTRGRNTQQRPQSKGLSTLIPTKCFWTSNHNLGCANLTLIVATVRSSKYCALSTPRKKILNLQKLFI